MNRNIARLLLAVALAVSLSSSAAAKMSDWDFVGFCKDASPAEVQAALDEGANVKAIGIRGYTPLHLAAEYNLNSDVIALLLQAGAEVHARSDDDSTPLHLVAWSNADPNAVTALLKAGADPNATNQNGYTPLHLAVMNPNPKIITILLEAGADGHARDKKDDTPLHLAASVSENPEVVIALLNAGCDVNAKNAHGTRPVDFAKSNRHLKGTDAFVMLENASREKLAAEAKKSDDAFIELCKTASLAEVQAAIDAGRDVNARNAEGRSPLLEAASHNPSPETITALLESGADVNARDKYGLTPLRRAAPDAGPEVIQALLNAGADVNGRAKDGGTPLSAAAMYNPDPGVIRMLLKAGADASHEQFGFTLLHRAAFGNSNPETINVLVEAGSSVNARVKPAIDGDPRMVSWTPLHLAAKYNKNPEVLAALLKAGADVNAKNASRDTPLHIAISGGVQCNPEVIKVLLDAGADVNTKNKKGERPIDLAEAKRSLKDTDVLQALRDASKVEKDPEDRPAREQEERILLFSSTATVLEDHSLEVHEEITVNVRGKEIRRGIFRDFQKMYRDADGNMRHRDFIFKSALLDGRETPYKVEESSNSVRVYIGDPDGRVPLGERMFTLVYVVTGQIRSLDEVDVLSWDITGSWSFTIEEARFSLSLPGDASFHSVEFSTGNASNRGQDARVFSDGSVVTTVPLLPGNELAVVYSWTKKKTP